jgi:beta-xylosidase
MNAEGTKTIGSGKIVFDGHQAHPTVEGTKFYKRNGFYYIFAPAGGVFTGWQLVLKAKNPYGPYEEHIALAQGETNINGPHQGAWVNLESGEDWFIHFQDKDAYGRIVHLQPMVWKDDWPTIGEDRNGDGTGQPVSSYKKPNVGKSHPLSSPRDSDEFDGLELGLQWQWHGNPTATWSFLNPSKSQVRLYTQLIPEQAKNLWELPNLLLQKFPAEEFETTTSLTFHPNNKLKGENVGLLIMGRSYAYLGLESKEDGIYLQYVTCSNAENGKAEVNKIIKKLDGNQIQLKVKVSKDAICEFSFSEDGETFIPIPDTFKASAGKWIGAKVGLFATRNSQTNDSGYADFDWFRFKK